jgi:hypothetical protein
MTPIRAFPNSSRGACTVRSVVSTDYSRSPFFNQLFVESNLFLSGLWPNPFARPKGPSRAQRPHMGSSFESPLAPPSTVAQLALATL